MEDALAEPVGVTVISVGVGTGGWSSTGRVAAVGRVAAGGAVVAVGAAEGAVAAGGLVVARTGAGVNFTVEIGRASCRERV